MIIKKPILNKSWTGDRQIWSLDGLFDQIKLPFNRFFVFLSLAILMAIGLGANGFRIYNSSDAASLDLSRPGYQQVRKKTNDSKDLPVINPIGEIDSNFKSGVESAVEYYRYQVGTQPFSEAPLIDENLINPNAINM